MGTVGTIGSIIIGVIAFIVIVAIIVFLVTLFAPVLIGLIILAAIIGIGYWIYRKTCSGWTMNQKQRTLKSYQKIGNLYHC
jgi:membrane protein implicated in regulation of membrane protease activity